VKSTAPASSTSVIANCTTTTALRGLKCRPPPSVTDGSVRSAGPSAGRDAWSAGSSEKINVAPAASANATTPTRQSIDQSNWNGTP